MTISFDLQPDIEEGLAAQAQAKGVSLAELVKEIIVRQASNSLPEAASAPRTGRALVDVCAEIRGLLSDEEIDQLFARERDYGRDILL
jgi:hypothetical protein